MCVSRQYIRVEPLFMVAGRAVQVEVLTVCVHHYRSTTGRRFAYPRVLSTDARDASPSGLVWEQAGGNSNMIL